MNSLFIFAIFGCTFFFTTCLVHSLSVSTVCLVPFHNFSSFAEAIADVELYIRRINETYNFASFLFALSVRGRSVVKKAQGTADLENGRPAQVVDMLYRFGSLSKTFTAVLVGRLVDQGLLHFEDLVSKYLSERTFPAKQINGQLTNMIISSVSRLIPNVLLGELLRLWQSQ